MTQSKERIALPDFLAVAMVRPVDGHLPQRLDEILEAITDREFGLRLRHVMQAAAHAIERLSSLDLLKLEPTAAEEGGANLSAFEQLAPPVRDTIVNVNALVYAIDAEFDREAQVPADLASNSDTRAEAESALIFRAVLGRLEHDVTAVGQLMRNPELVGSRWALIGELQRMRAEFRSRIGDAVYLSAATCAPVRREEVVPGFTQELARAALFRSTAADLRRSVEQKVNNPTIAPPKLAAQIEADFEIFATLPSWRHVRAGPKRGMLQLRNELSRASKNRDLGRAELQELAEPALVLLRELADEQTRMLPTYDRTTWTAAGQLLEQALLHLELGTSAGATAFTKAVIVCEGLAGRTNDFDAYLRTVRGKTFYELTAAQLRAAVEKLKEQLGALAL